MHEIQAKDSLADFVTVCKSHKLKVTPQRIAIIQELLETKAHPTADFLFRKIQRKQPHISFDTVNRTLKTFSEIGIIDVVEGLGRQRRYDANPHSHHHLHCVKCGEIIDFYHDAYNKLAVPEEIQKKYRVINKRVMIKVLCSECVE